MHDYIAFMLLISPGLYSIALPLIHSENPWAPLPVNDRIDSCLVVLGRAKGLVI